MKVFLQPPTHMSLAMFRVASALELTAPDGVDIVAREDQADVLILHVIGHEAITYRTDKRVAVMQYCLGTAGASGDAWHPLWARSLATWSYYDLRPHLPRGARFYHAPLGIADIFTDAYTEMPRSGVMTSGYVTGPNAEAIEEVTIAAKTLDLQSVHLGPRPVGGSSDTQYNVTGLLSDAALARLYRRIGYVSGLRFVEGFEMCAAEGLACGARPIMFNRPDAHWFGDHAEYVPEYNGYSLVRELKHVLARRPRPVTPEERAEILVKFNWDTLARGFWQMITEAA